MNIDDQNPGLQLLSERYREIDVMTLGGRFSEIAVIVESERLDVRLIETDAATHITDSSVSKGIGLRTARPR